MKTLLLNPPSFPNFDGGASSRWPAAREIASFWYPVWLAYPAGLIKDSRLLDAGPHGVTPEETIQMSKDYDFVALYTSTPGWKNDVRLAEMMKAAHPGLKLAFVGPPVTSQPDQALNSSEAIDFVVRKEIDYALKEFAEGREIRDIQGVSFRKDGRNVHNADRPPLHDLDSLPFASDVYKRDLDITRYNVPFLLNPYISFYTSRGCPALCTFCLWPQTHSGHRWRLRSTDDVASEVRYALEAFPQMKEIFFDDDTFNYQKARTIELCAKLKPLKFTWSCTSRVTTDYDTLKAMKEAGYRLLIVGYESGDPQILKNIKKVATGDMAERFTANCKKLGLVVHGDYIIGLPGETPQSLRKTIDFAKRLDNETIQVSIAHPYPGTEFYDYAKKNDLITIDSMTDEVGHQLPTVIYPGLDRAELVDWVERFYGEYYFRPRVIWRVVRKAIFDSTERKRLTKEAREYLALRAKRKKFVTDTRRAAVSAN